MRWGIWLAAGVIGWSAAVSADCLPDGSKFGKWVVQFAGYGCVTAEQGQGGLTIEENPKASMASSETHAALVTGPELKPPYIFRAQGITRSQLRRNNPPNTWEAGWWVFDYADRPDAQGGKGSFYYVILKPNGWELGKRDVNYPGGQRFLATGEQPRLVIGQPAMLEIERRGTAHMEIYMLDASNKRTLLTAYDDAEHPYESGAIGFYDEDADVLWSDMDAKHAGK